jgi:DNA-binding NtrC family response regulator
VISTYILLSKLSGLLQAQPYPRLRGRSEMATNSASDTSKMKVLFVDDEPNLLRAYERLFRKQIDVRTAVGAQEGLAILRHEAFEAIVSDMRMPGMDGTAFLSKAQVIAPNSVLILLSGNPTSDHRGAGFECLQKPCPRAEMLVVLEEAHRKYLGRVEAASAPAAVS